MEVNQILTIYEKRAIDILNEFGIENEVEIVSAHRTPEKMMDYGKNAHLNGYLLSLLVQVVQHIYLE